MTLDASHVDTSIARALKGESGLDPEVLKIHGFSTPTMRRTFNNICNIEGLVYCEVGVFKGGSFVSAFNNNPITAFGIDDFSQDFSQNNIKDELTANLARWQLTAKHVAFLEEDCFAVPGKYLLPHFDVFTYDGRHDTEPTAKALPAFFHMLADRFIYIVDDFHWKTVSDGVAQGFETLAGRVKIEQEWKLSGKRRQDDPIFHNGLAIFLCSKVKS